MHLFFLHSRADQRFVEMIDQSLTPMGFIVRDIPESGFPVEPVFIAKQAGEGIVKNPPQQPGGWRCVAVGIATACQSHDLVSHPTDGNVNGHNRSSL
jgi:hypothetical protein